jgi:hypothetical protein
MTSVTMSQATQNAISLALTAPGTNNQNGGVFMSAESDAVPLNDNPSIFDTARIKYGGSNLGGRDEKPIEMFVVEATQGSFWFEAYYEFAENGNDFLITVRNFGLYSKSAAGSPSPTVRRSFSATQAQAARSRLEALFLGRHDNPDLPFVPFRWGKGKCLGVTFPDGWITVK